jgi:hypothetical protein
MRAAALASSSETAWSFILQSIRQWVTNEGRFFPISAIENVYLFAVIQSVTTYKAIQLAVLIGTIMLVGYFVSVISGSKSLWIVGVVTTGASVQTRYWYDPTFGFGLLLQSVSVKILLSILCLHFAMTKPKQVIWMLGSLTFWVLALLQYEVVITLLPSLIITALITSKHKLSIRILAVSPHAVCSVAFFVLSQYLRSGKSIAPAYTTNTSISEVLPTYAKQLSASIPLSPNLWGFGPRLTDLRSMSIFYLIFGVAALVALGGIRREFSVQRPNRRRLVSLLVIGVNFALGPGFPTSLSVRWQSELTWGFGYLPVFIQYLGVAIVLAALLALLATLNFSKFARISQILALTLLVFSGSANAQLLRKYVDLQSPGKIARELFSTAVRNGLFESVPDGAVIQSPLADPNTWVNSYFTSWLGGPNHLVFVRDDFERDTLCKKERCEQIAKFSLTAVDLGDGTQGLVLASLEEAAVVNSTAPIGVGTKGGLVRLATTKGANPVCSDWSTRYIGSRFMVYDCLPGASWKPDLSISQR